MLAIKRTMDQDIKIINVLSRSINRLAIGAWVVFRYILQHHINTITLLGGAQSPSLSGRYKWQKRDIQKKHIIEKV